MTLPKIQGGYIWKFEWMAAEEPTLPCTGPAATCWNYLEVRDPRRCNRSSGTGCGLRPGIPRRAARGELRRPDTGYRKYIDVDSFIDQMIVNELSREMDAYVRSCALLQGPGQQDLRGSAVGLDLSFGVGGFFANDQVSGWQYQQTRQPVGQRLVRPVAARSGVRQPGPVTLADAATGPALRRRPPDPDQRSRGPADQRRPAQLPTLAQPDGADGQLLPHPDLAHLAGAGPGHAGLDAATRRLAGLHRGWGGPVTHDATAHHATAHHPAAHHHAHPPTTTTPPPTTPGAAAAPRRTR